MNAMHAYAHNLPLPNFTRLSFKKKATKKSSRKNDILENFCEDVIVFILFLLLLLLQGSLFREPQNISEK